MAKRMPGWSSWEGSRSYGVGYGFNSPILKKKKKYKECEIRMLYVKDVIKGETTKGSTGTRVTLLIGAIYHGVAQRIGPLTSVTC